MNRVRGNANCSHPLLTCAMRWQESEGDCHAFGPDLILLRNAQTGIHLGGKTIFVSDCHWSRGREGISWIGRRD